jgi:diguanylate cyclase (GGDEF)-like protein
MGDMALCDAGSLLKKVFGAYHIYRFGGDEFIVIKNNTTLEEVREAFKVLDMELEKFNEVEHPYKTPLAIAKGAAEFYPRKDDEYLTTFKRADRAMYLDKNRYYEMHSDKHRR